MGPLAALILGAVGIGILTAENNLSVLTSCVLSAMWASLILLIGSVR